MLLLVLGEIYCSSYFKRLDLTRNGRSLNKECEIFVRSLDNSREIRKEYNRVINSIYLEYDYIIIVIVN